MYDLATLKTLNARREAQLRAARKAVARRIKRAIARYESLALDSAEDRATLARKLAGVL